MQNKKADQLCSNCAPDQHLCFRYIDSTNPLPSKSKPLAIFHGCTARFLLELFGNPEDRFYHNATQFIIVLLFLTDELVDGTQANCEPCPAGKECTNPA